MTTLPAPRLCHISIRDGDGAEITADAVSYSVTEGMIFWTNTDRSTEAVNLDRVAYIHITPPPVEEPS